MKILFVHDVAHTFEDLASSLINVGIQTEFVDSSSLVGLIRKIRKSDADIIHANYIRSPAYAALLSKRRPYVLQAHGDDVRHGLNTLKKLAIKFASKIFYATQDLKEMIPNGVYLPRPIDTTKFSNYLPTKERKALYIEQSTGDPRSRTNEPAQINYVLDYCRKNDYELTYKTKRDISYSEMPNFLSQFSLFFDHAWPVYSKTALQAMAMKIPVLPEKGIPQSEQFEYAMKHDSRIVARILKDEYESL